MRRAKQSRSNKQKEPTGAYFRSININETYKRPTKQINSTLI